MPAKKTAEGKVTDLEVEGTLRVEKNPEDATDLRKKIQEGSSLSYSGLQKTAHSMKKV